MNTDRSPMFNHAIESFEHGLQHYLDGTEGSRKFALLHLDQAIELFLKEKIVRLGKSIYKNDGTTLTLHESFSSLKSLDIPERPRLEEVHDLRNTVQHKGLTPDQPSTEFYVRVLYEFAKRFLCEELDTVFETVIDARHRAFMEGVSIPEIEEVRAIFDTAKLAPTPSDKIVSGYTAMQRAVNFLSKPDAGITAFRTTIRHVANSRGISRDIIKPYLDTIMRLRSEVVHSEYLPSDNEADDFLEACKEVLVFVGIIDR